MSNKILFFIPARGGSKGLPGKNTKLLNGRPLIYWSILAAKNSGIAGDIVVSTDNSKIAKIAKKYGAEVPFMRPASLAKDDSTTIDVIKDFYEWSKTTGKKYETIILLQPTSPLRVGNDIKEAYRYFISKKCISIVSVCKCSYNPSWVNTLPKSMNMKDFLPKASKNANRQQYPQRFELNGAICLGNFKKIISNNSFYTDKTFAFEMPTNRSVDIDVEEDLVLAKYFMSMHKSLYKSK